MKLRFRLPAAGLALTLLLTPMAQALTPDQAIGLLDTFYIDPLPQSVREQTTISGILEALGDPYTEYFTAEELAAFNASLSDVQQVGAGLSLSLTDGGLLVNRVIPDSAAEAGGLLAGDIVTAVDGTSLAGMDLNEASALLTGQEGTTFRLTYLREGQSHTVTLTRKAFVVPTAYGELMDGHIGYLTCDVFGDETADHVAESLGTYASQADRWIMDLRGNGGGNLTAALDTISCFTGGPASRLVYLMQRDNSLSAQGSKMTQLTDAPLIVLTNGQSASASELVSAALRDTGSGLLVGERTYGKGVAQVLLDEHNLPQFFPDGDALKVTTYRFFSPAGTSNDTVGVMPHLLLDQSLADEAAVLLSASEPQGSTSGMVRMDWNGAWYIDLEQACSPDYQAAFTALLEALPDGVLLRQGTGSGWEATSADALAAACSLTNYAPRGFTDTAQSPYSEEIDLLATYGVLLGAGDGTFYPTQTLTRAQLCALLAQAINCRVPTGESQFSDVSMDDWYCLAVNALASMGLVTGVGGGRFDPDAPVSHEQFITILARLGRRLDLGLIQTWQDRPDTASAEYSGYSSWAWDSVWLLAQDEEGLLWASPADIDPTAATTREEAAALTCTLLCRLNLLPSLL